MRRLENNRFEVLEEAKREFRNSFSEGSREDPSTEAIMGIASWFKPTSKTLVGVDIGTSAVKVAQMRKKGSDSFRLINLASESLPPDSIADGVIISKLAVSEAIGRIFKSCNIRDTKIASSICGHSVIVKKVSLPLQTAEELRDSIQWEAEQYIPFDISEVNLDYQILGNSEQAGRIDVLLVAAKKDKIIDQTTVFSMAGQRPTIVDIDAFALQNAFEVNYRPERRSVVALLDFGSSIINVDIVKGDQFLFTRDIAMGGNQYNEALQKELNISAEEAEKCKITEAPTRELNQKVEHILDAVSELLTLEIQKTFDFFKTNAESADIKKIYLSGGASRTRGLQACLQEKLEVPTENLDPFRNIVIDNQSIPQEFLTDLAGNFTIAVGLALRSE